MPAKRVVIKVSAGGVTNDEQWETLPGDPNWQLRAYCGLGVPI